MERERKKENNMREKTLFCTNKTIQNPRCQRLGVHICKNHVVYRSTVHCTGFDVVVKYTKWYETINYI